MVVIQSNWLGVVLEQDISHNFSTDVALSNPSMTMKIKCKKMDTAAKHTALKADH